MRGHSRVQHSTLNTKISPSEQMLRTLTESERHTHLHVYFPCPPSPPPFLLPLPLLLLQAVAAMAWGTETCPKVSPAPACALCLSLSSAQLSAGLQLPCAVSAHCRDSEKCFTLSQALLIVGLVGDPCPSGQRGKRGPTAKGPPHVGPLCQSTARMLSGCYPWLRASTFIAGVPLGIQCKGCRWGCYAVA